MGKRRGCSEYTEQVSESPQWPRAGLDLWRLLEESGWTLMAETRAEDIWQGWVYCWRYGNNAKPGSLSSYIWFSKFKFNFREHEAEIGIPSSFFTSPSFSPSFSSSSSSSLPSVTSLGVNSLPGGLATNTSHSINKCAMSGSISIWFPSPLWASKLLTPLRAYPGGENDITCKHSRLKRKDKKERVGETVLLYIDSRVLRGQLHLYL